jgi:sialate O-acetylesterase
MLALIPSNADQFKKGLIAKNGELKDFTIAGADKVFVPAKAVIKKDKIYVSAEGVAKPVAVRAGWRLCPQMNLYNTEGLPATPFRTDVPDTKDAVEGKY